MSVKKQKSIKRLLALATAALLVPGLQLPVSAQNDNDDLPLKPPIANDGQPLLNSGQVADPAATSANIVQGSVSARESSDQDFSRHKSSARTMAKGKTSAPPTGASGDKSGAVLLSGQEGIAGPSRTTASAPAPVLKNDTIQLGQPPLKSLVSVNDYLNPFTLDAKATQSLNLRNALFMGLDQNLDLAISRTNSKQKQLAYFSSLGNFLPDPTMGFSEYFTKGRVGLPGAFSQLAGGSAAGSAYGTSSKSETISVRKPFEIMHAGFDYYAYRGGSILFGASQAKHNYKAAQSQEKGSVRDTLLTVTQNYYNLVLAEALLKIRVQAVRTSEEQLKRNSDRMRSGLATNLDVLQSRTQLSRDRQALVDQQTNRRSAAITLAESLYSNLGEDLIPVETDVKKIRLIDARMTISDLLQLALDNRPELKQYEEQRLAAKRAIIVEAAKLQPTVLLSANIYGIGPPANVQALNIFSVNVNWRLKGMGTVDGLSVEQARWQARQAALQSKKEIQTVLSQVRNAYLQILDKEKNIDETSNEVTSALEELRLAELRKANGLGLNLDVITAQRDYTQALVDKAQALINFDIAQAQLVHDIGLISIDALTGGRLVTSARLVK